MCLKHLLHHKYPHTRIFFSPLILKRWCLNSEMSVFNIVSYTNSLPVSQTNIPMASIGASYSPSPPSSPKSQLHSYPRTNDYEMNSLMGEVAHLYDRPASSPRTIYDKPLPKQPPLDLSIICEPRRLAPFTGSAEAAFEAYWWKRFYLRQGKTYEIQKATLGSSPYMEGVEFITMAKESDSGSTIPLKAGRVCGMVGLETPSVVAALSSGKSSCGDQDSGYESSSRSEAVRFSSIC